MANNFQRVPVAGGDSNVWGAQLLAQLDTGILSGKFYNSGGVLNVPACKIGIDDGAVKGVCDIDTITAVSLAGCSNSNWLAIEMAISGTAVIFSATDIAGATDPTIIPATVKAAWDGLKNGFYLTATKRLIGLAWKNAGGVLLGVVNFEGRRIYASQIGLHTGTIHEQEEPGKGFVFEIGNWDMNASALTGILLYLGVFLAAIGNVSCWIIPDDDSASAGNRYNLGRVDNVSGATSGGVTGAIASPEEIAIYRTASGIFDNTTFDKTPFNRGHCVVSMRNF